MDSEWVDLCKDCGRERKPVVQYTRQDYVDTILSHFNLRDRRNEDQGIPSEHTLKVLRSCVEKEVDHQISLGAENVVLNSLSALSRDWSRVLADLNSVLELAIR